MKTAVFVPCAVLIRRRGRHHRSVKLRPNRILQIAKMLEAGPGYEQENQNDNQPLFRLRENEKLGKAYHAARRPHPLLARDLFPRDGAKKGNDVCFGAKSQGRRQTLCASNEVCEITLQVVGRNFVWRT